ncbi:MAG TPA: nitrate ABC transporter substrate-binding protein, partial [Methylophilus sp.]
DIYTQAAKALGISVPTDPMRSTKLIDGVVWNGSNPAAYANGFKVKA